MSRGSRNLLWIITVEQLVEGFDPKRTHLFQIHDGSGTFNACDQLERVLDIRVGMFLDDVEHKIDVSSGVHFWYH